MKEDPDFMKYDVGLLWAKKWLSKDLIRYAARKYGVVERNMTNQ